MRHCWLRFRPHSWIAWLSKPYGTLPDIVGARACRRCFRYQMNMEGRLVWFSMWFKPNYTELSALVREKIGQDDALLQKAADAAARESLIIGLLGDEDADSPR